MKVHPRFTFLLIGAWLLTGCGVKGPPRPPEPKSQPQTSDHKVVPRVGGRLALSTPPATTP